MPRAVGKSTSRMRSSAASCARVRMRFIACSRVCLTLISTRSRTIVSTSRPTYPTSVNFVASTLMNGASASLARRRAISVLPTPVGPIIRMFFGVISWRRGSATCSRRQRLRSAIATARFARPCPTMYLSSSWTISCGCIEPIRPLIQQPLFEEFDGPLMVGVDAEICGNRERLVDDFARAELRVLQERQRGALRIRPARADGDDAELGLEHIARAGDDERMLAIGHRQHRLEAPQDAVGAPVLGELDRRAHQVALVLVELRFEALEQRERVRGAAGEPGEEAVLGEAAHLLCAALDDDVAERHLPVAAERDLAVAAHGKNGGAMEFLHGMERLFGADFEDIKATPVRRLEPRSARFPPSERCRTPPSRRRSMVRPAGR